MTAMSSQEHGNGALHTRLHEILPTRGRWFWNEASGPVFGWGDPITLEGATSSPSESFPAVRSITRDGSLSGSGEQSSQLRRRVSRGRFGFFVGKYSLTLPFDFMRLMIRWATDLAVRGNNIAKGDNTHSAYCEENCARWTASFS